MSKDIASTEQENKKSNKKVELTPEQISYRQKVEVAGRKFSLDMYLVAFLTKNPFWAEISRRIHKIPTRNISTASVTWHKEFDNLVLYYNPEFLATLTEKQVIGVITHEYMHIVYGHLNDRRRKPSKLWNFATDAAINSIIYSNDNVNFNSDNNQEIPLPLYCIMPGRKPYVKNDLDGTVKIVDDELLETPPYAYAKCLMNLAPMLTSDHYFAELMKVRQEQNKDCCKTCGGYGLVKNPNKKDKSENENNDSQNEGKDSSDKSDNESCKNNGKCDCKHEGDEKSNDSGSGSANKNENDDYIECPDCGGTGGEGDSEGMGNFDDHDMWDDIPDDMRDYINSRIRNVIEKAVSAADKQSNGWGNIPADLASEIRKSVSRKVPWRSVLRQFIGTTIPGDRTTSIKRINKRYPYIHPGLKRGRRPKLLIAIDQSGSVSDEMMSLFFAELTMLAKNCDIDILPFDCAANEKEIYTWRKGTQCPKGRQHCGGTNFDAPTDVLNDVRNRGRWDGCLIVTDGEAPEPKSSRIKRGWVLPPNQKLHFSSNELQVFIDKERQMVGAWR